MEGELRERLGLAENAAQEESGGAEEKEAPVAKEKGASPDRRGRMRDRGDSSPHIPA
jgi:hypothetical protein